MRSLLNTIRDWLYSHSPGRIPELMEDTATVARVRDLESRLAAMEAVLDRFGPQMPVTGRHLASVTPIRAEAGQ